MVGLMAYNSMFDIEAAEYDIWYQTPEGRYADTLEWEGERGTVHDTSRSLEQKYRSAVAGLYARLRSNYDTIYEKFGDEGLTLIADMSRRYGLEVAERARKRVEGDDIRSVGEYIARIFETVNAEFEVIEEGDDKLIIKAYRCPLNFDKPGMCLAHTVMEKTVVEELGSNLTYRIGKSIPAGDPYCEHILETKPLTQA